MGEEEPSLHVADRGSGPPVLLVHGQPGVSDDWDPVSALLQSDHRLLAPDRPGYGRTTVEALSMADNAELLEGLLVGRNAAPAVVVGHSYGGGIAILLASRRADLVRGLVLVGSVGVAQSVNGFDHLLALPGVGEVLSTAALVTFGQVLPRLRPLASLLPPRASVRVRAGLPDERYLAAITRSGRRIGRTFVAEQRSLLAEIDDVEAALGGVAVPTVVMTGTLDMVVPPSVAASLAARISGAELCTVSRAGHFLPRLHPEAVAAAVRRVGRR